MNKKIVKSVLMIGAVLAMVGGATFALFSDTETSTGNTFTAGTIDIAVDDQNPWEREGSFALVDMKPCYTDYIDFTIYNEGNNPANIWKTLKGFETDPGNISEPECVAESGTWDATDKICSDNDPVYNIHAKILYDMQVKLYKVDPKTHPDVEPVWWEMIYVDEDGVTLKSLQGKKMFLGMIPSGWWLEVKQSYHMPDTVGNKYQGDKLTFDIELYAEQLTNTVVLENKEKVDYGNESHTLHDETYAEVTYKVMDRAFAYEISTYSVTPGEYTLFAWEDAGDWPWDNRDNALALANITVAGDTTYSNSIDLGTSFTNAKIWLVPGTYTPGTKGYKFPWSQDGILFETGLADYYDADL